MICRKKTFREKRLIIAKKKFYEAINYCNLYPYGHAVDFWWAEMYYYQFLVEELEENK